MAKKNLHTKKGKPQTEEKKKGKKKWIFILLALIILISVAAIKFLGKDKEIIGFFNEQETVVEEPSGIIVVEKETNDKGFKNENLIKEKSRQERKKRRIRKPGKGYYVKVEDCVVSKCQQEVIRYLQKEKLPIVKTTYSKNLQYFELMSSSVFNLQRAKEKIRIINKYSGKISTPYLVSNRNKYQISLGLFPQETDGLKMKSTLGGLYQQVEVGFELVPRKRVYTVTSILVGPFNKSKAIAVLDRIQNFTDFESSKVIVNPK
ncbi:hypothetical protein KKA14_12060 [bacterium]|nr:hypothetical protein [bacterium]